MTVKDAIRAVKIELNKLDTNSYRDLAPETIVYYFNKAIKELIKRRFGKNNNTGRGLEEDTKRTTDLREAIIQGTLPVKAKSTYLESAYTFDIPLDMWFPILLEAKILGMDCAGEEIATRAEVSEITHANVPFVRKDPFNRPKKDKVYCIYHGREISVFINLKDEIEKVWITYVSGSFKIPYKALYTTEELPLGDSIHEEIVAEAIHGMKLAIESKTFNANENLLNKTE